MRSRDRLLWPFRRVGRAVVWFVDWGGNRAAAALTYYLFLSAIPVLLLSASVTGFVLRENVPLRDRLLAQVETLFPGSGAQEVVSGTLSAPGTLGVLGSVALVLLGFGVLDSLREGTKQVWGLPQGGDPLLWRKGRDLLLMLFLAPLVLVSLAASVLALRAASSLLRALDVEAFATTLVLRGTSTILAAGLTVGVLMVVFTAVVGRPAPRRALVSGAVLGAVLVEFFKYLFVLYLDNLPGGDTLYGPALSGAVGVLVWLNLVSRVLFLSAAWARTARAFEDCDPCVRPAGRLGPPV